MDLKAAANECDTANRHAIEDHVYVATVTTTTHMSMSTLKQEDLSF